MFDHGLLRSSLFTEKRKRMARGLQLHFVKPIMKLTNLTNL